MTTASATPKLADSALLRGLIQANIVIPVEKDYGGHKLTMGKVPVEDIAEFILEDPKAADELFSIEEGADGLTVIVRIIKTIRPTAGKIVASSAGYKNHPEFLDLAHGLTQVSDDLLIEMLIDAFEQTMPRGFGPFFAQLTRGVNVLRGDKATSGSAPLPSTTRGRTSTTRSSSSSNKRRR